MSKKIVIVDGGPRKAMNTAALIESLKDGARSVSDQIEVKIIRLYDLDYKGCMSCLACKVKGSKFTEVCAYKDGLSDALREAAYADGLVFASPIYFSQVTAQMRAFIERLIFPWLSYSKMAVTAPKRIPTAVIYTMNAWGQFVENMKPFFDHFESLIAMGLEKPERIEAQNTLQVKQYDRYEMAAFSVEDKQRWHEEQWPQDLRRAYDVGAQMAKRILADDHQ